MTHDQSQSYPGNPTAGLEPDLQDSTRFTVGSHLGLTDSHTTMGSPRLVDGKLHALDLVGENYEIISLIGVGGMGYVYRVRHRILQKQYAMKTLSAEHVNEIAWRRLQVEAQAIARMNHPNIVGIHNLGLHEDRLPYYVMDLLDGEALADRIKACGPLTLAQALPIFIEACTGLAYAHKKGIIHRDIKPGNIVVLKEPDAAGASVKIVDFGIAKLSGASDPSNQHLTSVGEVFGSPYYMSPEQCEGKRIDGRSDIYSMGCTIFEALVGHPPFQGNNPVQTMVMHQSHEPPSLSDVSGQDFPDDVEELVAKLLAKAPMDRYQSLDKVAEDLKAILDGRAIQTRALFNTHLNLHTESEDGDDDASARSPRFFWSIAATVAITGVLLSCLALWLLQNNKYPTKTAIATVTTSSITNKSSMIDAPVQSSTSLAKPADIVADDSTAAASSAASHQPYSHLATDKDGKSVIEFVFPEGEYLGRLRNGASHQYISASGTKQFPANAKLQLNASPQLMDEIHLLSRFRPTDLYGIQFFQQAMPRQKKSSSAEFLLPENYDSDIAKALVQARRLTSLRRLDVSYCVNATNKEIALINQMPEISELTVSHTSITGEGLAQLKNLKQLKVLNYADGTKLHTLLKALAGSKKLTWLVLNHPVDEVISDQDWQLIASCKNITRLDVEHAGLGRNGIAALATMPHLEVLCAKGNQVDLACFPDLKKMQQLTAANFDSPVWNNYCKQAMATQLPQVKTANFD